MILEWFRDGVHVRCNECSVKAFMKVVDGNGLTQQAITLPSTPRPLNSIQPDKGVNATFISLKASPVTCMSHN